ncbi:MAG TPA: serine protease [Puia sp.]
MKKIISPLFLFFACNCFYAAAQNYTAVENYELNRPGVVMIKTVFSANVYVKNMQVANREFNKLLDSIQRVDTSGVAFTSEQKLDIVLREMNNHPGRFFKAAYDYMKQPEEITASGTGFFITGDGYVATNCHLIESDNAFIKRQFILTAFQQITDGNIQAIENSWAAKFTEQQKSSLYATFASVYTRLFPMSLYDLKKNIYVVYPHDENKNSVIKKLASVIVKGSQMPGKDVAILKIDGDSALPTLKIDGSELPEVGEQLFVYGYPGPVTNNDFVSAGSAIEPTLTTGIVSAIKKSVNGWPVIQMDASINHGSSGGPVCNNQGEVIGLTTFGSLENSGGLAAGLNFAIPISILYEYIDSAEITPVQSNSTKLFLEGLNFYNKKYYHKALNCFEKVKDLNNFYPTINLYISNSKAKIKKGEDKELGVIKSVLEIAILLAVIVILFFLFKKRRN